MVYQITLSGDCPGFWRFQATASPGPAFSIRGFGQVFSALASPAVFWTAYTFFLISTNSHGRHSVYPGSRT